MREVDEQGRDRKVKSKIKEKSNEKTERSWQSKSDQVPAFYQLSRQ